jgi:hypothetical protein
MPRALLAVLAHHQPDALARLVANLRAFTSDAQVVLFNGGSDPTLGRGLDVEVCPYSRPLDYGRLARFHFETLRWLAEQRVDYEFVVTVEPDMALLGPGLEDAVSGRLRKHGSGYLAAGLWERTWSALPIGMTRRKWHDIWQPLLGGERPWGCLNPGQVFGRGYADRLLALPLLGELLDRMDRTRIHAMEEVVWPTLAASLGLAPNWPPYGRTIALHRHPPQTYRRLLAEPGPHLVHKVGTAPDDPDRQIVSAVVAGRTPEFDLPAGYAARRRPLRAVAHRVRIRAELAARRLRPE